MNDPKRYTPDYTFTGTAFVPTTREFSEGEYVRYEDYDRLKAEVERLTAFTTRTIIPNEELKAENARLKAKVSDLECDAETRYRQSMDDEYEIEWLNKITHGLMKEKEQLQAQVERLTKAGDKLHAFLINYIVESRISSAHLNKLDDGWLAAKEVKPRA